MKSHGNCSVSKGQAQLVSLDLIEGLCAAMSPLSLLPFLLCWSFTLFSLVKAVQVLFSFFSEIFVSLWNV